MKFYFSFLAIFLWDFSSASAAPSFLPADYRQNTYTAEEPLELEYSFGPQEKNKAFLRVVNYPNKKSDLFFFHMHMNELTAKQAGEEAVRKNGGTFMYLIHSNESRDMKAQIGATTYTFDPNRIFTAKGLGEKTIPKPSIRDLAELEKFVNWVKKNIELGRMQRARTMVTALHNNSDDDAHGEVLSILTEKKLLGIDNRAVNANSEWDIDNFYIATMPGSYEALVARYNSNISLRLAQPRDIGYLSNWMIQAGIEYINVETQHEDKQNNLAMIYAIQSLLQ